MMTDDDNKPRIDWDDPEVREADGEARARIAEQLAAFWLSPDPETAQNGLEDVIEAHALVHQMVERYKEAAADAVEEGNPLQAAGFLQTVDKLYTMHLAVTHLEVMVTDNLRAVQDKDGAPDVTVDDADLEAFLELAVGDSVVSSYEEADSGHDLEVGTVQEVGDRRGADQTVLVQWSSARRWHPASGLRRV